MGAFIARVLCVLTGGHFDELQQSPIGIRLSCTRCARAGALISTGESGMADMVDFELSQIAASIAAQIHRADALRGEAPKVEFIALELPTRRHYLSLGEKAILLRQKRDQVVGIDAHRAAAKASLRAIQQHRPYCRVSPSRERQLTGLPSLTEVK